MDLRQKVRQKMFGGGALKVTTEAAVGVGGEGEGEGDGEGGGERVTAEVRRMGYTIQGG